MITKYGEKKIAVASSRLLTRQGGTAKEKVKLKDFFESATTTFDIFAFERSSDLFAQAPELLKEANKLSQPYFHRSIKEQDWILSLGSKASGIHFHHHADGWSYLFYGQKHWFFSEPTKTPYISHLGRIPMREWYEKYVYPRLLEHELPDECLQKEGELMYVPENWWHATVQPSAPSSPEYSISVASQLKQPLTEARFLWDEVLRLNKNNKFTRSQILDTAITYSRLAELTPGSSEIYNRLGHFLQQYRVEQEGNERDRDLQLVEMEIKALNTSVVLSEDRNCDILNDYAGTLISLGDCKESVRLLHKCIDLCAGFESSVSCLMNMHYCKEVLREPSDLLVAEANKLMTIPRVVRIGKSEIKL
jgi:hypothetical protein